MSSPTPSSSLPAELGRRLRLRYVDASRSVSAGTGTGTGSGTNTKASAGASAGARASGSARASGLRQRPPPSRRLRSSRASGANFSAFCFNVKLNPAIDMPGIARGQRIELVFEDDYYVDPLTTTSIRFSADGVHVAHNGPLPYGLVPPPPNFICEASTIKLYPLGASGYGEDTTDDDDDSDSGGREAGARKDLAGDEERESAYAVVPYRPRPAQPGAQSSLFTKLAVAVALYYIAAVTLVSIYCFIDLGALTPTATSNRPIMFEPLPVVTELAELASSHVAISPPLLDAFYSEDEDGNTVIFQIDEAKAAMFRLCDRLGHFLLVDTQALARHAAAAGEQTPVHRQEELPFGEAGLDALEHLCSTTSDYFFNATIWAMSVPYTMGFGWPFHVAAKLRRIDTALQHLSNSRNLETLGDGGQRQPSLAAIASANSSAAAVLAVLAKHVPPLVQLIAPIAADLASFERNLTLALDGMDAVADYFTAFFLNPADSSRAQRVKEKIGKSMWAQSYNAFMSSFNLGSSPAADAARARRLADSLRSTQVALAKQVAVQAGLQPRWERLSTRLQELRRGRGWVIRSSQPGDDYDIHFYMPALATVAAEIHATAESVLADFRSVVDMDRRITDREVAKAWERIQITLQKRRTEEEPDLGIRSDDEVRASDERLAKLQAKLGLSSQYIFPLASHLRGNGEGEEAPVGTSRP